MITQIKLHNFQCHKDLTLDMGRSTVLMGNSNSGKTAVLRALYWVIYNTPSGDSYVSYWAKGKTKFKADEYTSVVVTIDGHTIERKRSNDFNGYIVDGNTYEALKTSVPEEVTKIFNLADASVQRQMDAPFLLSSTPGEASQYLNSLAGLGCVDDILSIAKHKVADTSALIETTRESVEKFEKQSQAYSWVPAAEDLLNKASSLEPKIAELSNKVSHLRQTLLDYKAIKDYPDIPKWLETGDKSEVIRKDEDKLGAIHNYVNACRKISNLEPILDKLESLSFPVYPKYDSDDCISIEQSILDYQKSIKACKSISSILEKVESLDAPIPSKWDDSKLESLVKSTNTYNHCLDCIFKITPVLESLQNLKEPLPCKWTDKEFAILIRSIRMYHSLGKLTADIDVNLKETYDSISGMVCPVCGRPMDKDTCLL